MGDDPIEMLALAEEVAASAAGVDDTVEASALVQGAMALRFLGRNGEAQVRLLDAWDSARRRVLPQAVLEIGAALGRVLLSMGRIAETREILLECSSLGARLTEFGPGRTYLVTLPSLVEATTGDWRKAVAMLEVAAEREPEPHYRLHAHLERAAALARVDPDHASDEVHEAVAAALADGRTATCRRCLTEATVRGAEALARVGSLTGAESLISSAHVPVVDLYNSFWRDRATVAILAALDPSAAVPALERLIVDAHQQDLLLEAVAVRLDLGAALTSSDRGSAAAVLQAAGAAAERLGATTEVGLAERRLRSLGVRTWRREPTARRHDSLALLTGRERDIARLVAEGASNPEIASLLFLSRKTVERHVSNIFAKLGLRNRAALAALVPNASAEDPMRGVDEG
jgi:DNA-binding NarL/FixJ family response regulator